MPDTRNDELQGSTQVRDSPFEIASEKLYRANGWVFSNQNLTGKL
jgi:hypothetical protein